MLAHLVTVKGLVKMEPSLAALVIVVATMTPSSPASPGWEGRAMDEGERRCRCVLLCDAPLQTQPQLNLLAR